MFTLYTDAATETDSGRSAAGILIIHDGKQQQLKQVLPNGDNHQAEFAAALAGFKALMTLLGDTASQTTVRYFTDSKIVADSLLKHYAKHYQAQVDELLALHQRFAIVVTQWVPEKQNQGAHHLAQQALHMG
ncbi:ribonuclease HI [Secundilactobacillus odoratitofui DSM 19909 = JCM 15043]|uniref:Ribonuclease HI n=1 Tax=Secundilactobacillus odoratitofui DSM 19909 = JCM 15043 TaxID=1423776 RepID=A0A0R1LQB5_9LACO|nr:ribonuclease HI family protein [Secundilactobacillus odoratitofui]KRK98053.1 ribonuclease HI [Secundilactobacillus odoratitofui DSM 19909 = JCM 15043]